MCEQKIALIENVQTELCNIKYVTNPFADLDKNNTIKSGRTSIQEIKFRNVSKTPFSPKDANDTTKSDSTTPAFKASLMPELSTIPPTGKDAPAFDTID